ncbi:hypothetical protein ABVT39_003784 [Epinephelus coioides]
MDGGALQLCDIITTSSCSTAAVAGQVLQMTSKDRTLFIIDDVTDVDECGADTQR